MKTITNSTYIWVLILHGVNNVIKTYSICRLLFKKPSYFSQISRVQSFI